MRSANEISALVLKAARGAGMSLGCAEELARAAPVLASEQNLKCVCDVLRQPSALPMFADGVVSGGHPVQAIVAWQDLQAAGVAAKLECEGDKALLDALCHKGAVVGPFEVDEGLWRDLTAFAAQMLVPESEASRLAGAGAGLTDND